MYSDRPILRNSGGALSRHSRYAAIHCSVVMERARACTGFLRALGGLQPPLCGGLSECVDQESPVIVARVEVVAALDEYGDAKLAWPT
jgi:hypothetical protein